MDQGQSHEILCAISSSLGKDFNIQASIGTISENALQGNGTKEVIRNLVLIGASNLKRVIPHLNALGYSTLDLCVPGWVATPTNVSLLVEQLKSINLGTDVGIVIDLLGNSCTRFKDWDGSILRPYKGGGGYHLSGEVVVCTDNIFKNLIDLLMPIFSAVPGHTKIVVPPQPRYIFHPCCAEKTHCTNVGTVSHAETLIGSNLRLRALLKDELRSKGTECFWVADSCLHTVDTLDGSAAQRAAALRPFCALDGVHSTPEGYRNFAGNIKKTLEIFRTRTASVSVSGPVKKHYWRGFSSPVGSKLPVVKSVWKQPLRARPHTSSKPYMRKK
jgi:hypothetical protein